MNLDTTTEPAPPFARPGIDCAVGALLLLYLASYLFVNYVTRFAPVAFHSMILVFGVSAVVLLMFRGYISTTWSKLSFDWILFAALVLLFLVSTTLMNRHVSEWLEVRAYILSFFCFFFVRVAGVYLPAFWLHRLLIVFLIASGVQILCQVYFGMDYYVARYLGSDISTIYATGFATFPNLAGVMILWPLAIQVSKLAAEPAKLSKLYEWSAVVFGTVGLFFTLSRAAILGLGVVLVALLLARALSGRSVRRAALVVMVVVTSLATCYVIPSRLSGYVSTKTLGELPPHIRSFGDARNSEDTRGPGNARSSEGTRGSGNAHNAEGTTACEEFYPISRSYSLNTRLLIFRVSGQILADHPLWGAGVGRFSDYYQICFERLPQVVQDRLDPRTRVTTHNAYLESVTDVGVLFTVAVLALVFWTTRQVWICGADHMAFHLLIGLLAVMVWMLMHNSFKDRLFWIALALTLAHLPTLRQMTAYSSQQPFPRSCP